ncbi:alkyl sulfatase C-terminal domain-containing protein [Streptomyces sp. NPDC006617]|uniref:alkyl sulfatase C-terminal domain-containing protein n=1 Tax=Streptomyces sp. NPDC006617 TaxID=3155354 RepID=UPI0033A7C13B
MTNDIEAPPGAGAALGPDVRQALAVGQLIDGLAVRVNGPKARAIDLTIGWHVDDGRWRLRLANGLLT